MTSLFSRMFGAAAPATSDAIRPKLDEARAALARNAERVSAAEAVLNDVAVMNAAEHRLADDELGEARREGVRLAALVAGLGEVLAATEKAEADAALKARAAELHRRVDGVGKLLDRYAILGAEIGEIVGEIMQIESDARAHNAALPRGQGDLAVQLPEARFRTMSGSSRPEKRERQEHWEVYDHIHGTWGPAIMTRDADGKRVPAGPAARRAFRDVVVQHARETPPRPLLPIAEALRLPPARAGSPQLWPRKG